LQGFLDLEVSMYSCQELSEMFYRIMPSGCRGDMPRDELVNIP
jgi:hypothetical protein